MKRKIWLIAAAAMICTVMFAVGAHAVTIETEGAYTYMAQNGTATITAVSTSISGDVVIPTTLGGNTVRAIQKGVFNNCDSITSITVPAEINSIGEQVFVDCNALTAVNVSADNEFYTSVDGVLFTKDKKTLIAYPAGKADTEYTVPSGVTAISGHAFYACWELEKVNLPYGVISIGEYAFYDNNLNSINFPDSITSIGNHAFCRCSFLESISFPNSVAVIGECVFGASGLVSVMIPSSVISIGNAAFEGCNELANVTISNGTTSIGSSAFNGCDKLTSITIPITVTSISDHAFFNCDNLTTAVIPGSVTEIGIFAFSDCPNLTIYGYSGTCAETYAKEYNINFVALDLNYGIPAPEFIKNLYNKTYLIGSATSRGYLEVLAKAPDNGPVTYQWYISDTGVGDWTALEGETGTRLYVPIDELGEKYYYVTATNTGSTGTASANSNIACVRVKERTNAEPPEILVQTQSVTCEVGEIAALFIVPSSADGTLTYQWYESDTEDGEFTLISGETEAVYKPDTSAEGKKYYYVIVTNTNTSVTGDETASVRSNIASVTVTAGSGYTVSGTVFSEGTTDTVTIELLIGDKVIRSVKVENAAEEAKYQIDNVPAGTYTMRVSKKNHVTREYPLAVGKP